VLAAARELAVQDGFSGLTLEKVAQRAGVTRLTIYYQFGSRQALLEEMLDYMAESGQLMTRLPRAFQKQDALDALDEFIAAFCAFWSSDQIGLRRLRGWAHLEPGFEEQGRGRDAWRKEGLQVLITKLRAQYAVPAKSALQDTIDVLHTLTSFETYDNLAHGGRTPAAVELLLKRTARALLGLP